MDLETFFTVISVCAVLCTIAVVFGKDKAQKSIIYPIYIVLIISVIGAVGYFGYQLLMYGLEKVNWVAVVAIGVVVLGLYINEPNLFFPREKSDKDKKDK